MVVNRGWGEGELVFAEYRVSVCENMKVLEMAVMLVAQSDYS